MAFDSSIMKPREFNPTAIPVTYAASVTPDGLLGNRFTITATGALTIATIANGYDGQTVRIEVTASGGSRAVTMTIGTGAFVATDAISLASATTVASGKVGVFTFTYSSVLNRWIPGGIYQTA